MSGLAVDHLVVVARSLDDGVAWCEATLGVTPAAGGRHALMGTHNRLLTLACDGFPRAYFEIIAIDPGAPLPARARWFGLDASAPATPRLAHWVARSERVAADRAAVTRAGFDPGELLAAERDTPEGPLRWRIGVPTDGRLQLGGALPTLIEWTGRHPAERLPQSGVQLRSLELHGMPAVLARAMAIEGVTLVDGPPGLVARLATPKGLVQLDSRAA